jgi:uridine phosphorylase
VYNGTYKGKEMFVANTGLGGPACAFLVEELIAHGVETIVRLGTDDYNVTSAMVRAHPPGHLLSDLPVIFCLLTQFCFAVRALSVLVLVTLRDTGGKTNKTNTIFVLESVRGTYGLPRDYGIASDEWGDAIPTDPVLRKALFEAAKKFPNITTEKGVGYSIDGFYSFFDPKDVAAHPPVVQAMIDEYQQQGCNCRDMESGALLMLGQLRKIRTASVLQAVVKSGHHHAHVGTIGIPVVLDALLNFA